MHPTLISDSSYSEEEALSTKKIVRNDLNYSNYSERFKIKAKNFERQYAHLYACRLAIMRNEVKKAALDKWGCDIKISHLCELQVDEKCVVIGTMYKDMQLKPSILKEISEKQDLEMQPVGQHFTHDNDELILEDELQRIKLRGLDKNIFVTGVIIAVYGQELDDDRGTFHVESYCFKQLSMRPERPLPSGDEFVALISGLELGRSNDNPLSIQLMVDLLTGELGSYRQQLATARIVKVIVCGNSLSELTQSKNQLSKAKYLTKKTTAKSVEPIKELDNILVQLAASVDVDVMPGQFDPANYILPQQPLHPCMFPQSSSYKTFHCVSNPYECEINGVRFLGTSGQNISDIEKYTNSESNMKILENTLEWGHIAPTAPDTLGCYPYYDQDPFIIENCPHVYYAGNQPQYDTNLYSKNQNPKVRLITVPRFSETKTCVIVNLRTLETTPIIIDEDLF